MITIEETRAALRALAESLAVDDDLPGRLAAADVDCATVGAVGNANELGRQARAAWVEAMNAMSQADEDGTATSRDAAAVALARAEELHAATRAAARRATEIMDAQHRVLEEAVAGQPQVMATAYYRHD